MNTDVNEPTTPNPIPVETTPPAKSGLIYKVIAIIGLIILVIAVNATAIYFGTKKNSANAPTENPVTQPDETSNIPAEEPNPALPEDMGKNPNAVLDNTIPSENLPSNIAPELPPNEVVPENTAPTQ